MEQATAAGNGESRARIGISACLLGEAVRYDGQHKRNAFLVDRAAPLVEFVPVCPEVELGLGTPREPIHLRAEAAGVRLVGVRSGADHTDAMREYAARRVEQLAAYDLAGFILKKDSPSCGMQRVKVHQADGQAVRDGQGMFAAALTQRMPLLPVEEEGRLNDPALRENFFTRVFAYRRLQNLLARDLTAGRLIKFHTTEKLLLLAHDELRYRQLGRFVADFQPALASHLAAEYQTLFMETLGCLASPGRHANVLQHVAGFFKRQLTSPQRRELSGLIEDYRQGLVPLVVPLTLVRHYVVRFNVAYLRSQSYLEPWPKQLMFQSAMKAKPT